MNELIPVRGNNATEILMSDHEVIKSMLDALAAESSMDACRSMLEQLKGILTIHNATEENLVYPALREVAGKKWEAQRLYHETAEADMLVFKLDTMLKQGDMEGFARNAQKLRDAVYEHIEDEEQSAFPHLEDAADPQQNQMLTQEVRKFRGAMHFDAGGAGRATMGEV